VVLKNFLFFLFKWGFGRKWGNISSFSCFCCVSLFFANFGVLGTLILYGKISRGYLKKKEQEPNITITKSYPYFASRGLVKIVSNGMLINMKTCN
jgi:hypothetical protein